MKSAVFLFTFAVIAIVSCYAEDFKCVDQVPYVENHCNSCFCTNGLLACTEKLCISTETQAKCKAGDTWEESCNKCWCDGQIGTICENNLCY